MDQMDRVSLNVYQKRQAALLYHFASMDFLHEIIARVRTLAVFANSNVDLATRIERADAMRACDWRACRDDMSVPAYGEPALNSCLRALIEQKRARAEDWYDIAGVSGTWTGMCHRYPIYWSSTEEEDKFLELLGEASGPAHHLDATINHTWADLNLTAKWEACKPRFTPFPTFRVHTDIEAETGQLPPRTGVYVPQDDPYGALQFAWTGNTGGELGKCQTLSDLAREYLALVGRGRLWTAPGDAAGKPDRVHITDQYFDDWCRIRKKMTFPDTISSRNARAWAERPCKWYFVECVPGEFEDEPVDLDAVPDTASHVLDEPDDTASGFRLWRWLRGRRRA
jgi:hypothetical protein